MASWKPETSDGTIEELSTATDPKRSKINPEGLFSTITIGKDVFRFISRSEALTLELKGFRQAAHIMIHAPVPNVFLFGCHPVEHAVMMQMRFDGYLGFPGGFIDHEDKTLEDGLCREIREELGKSNLGFGLSPEDYLMSHVCEKKKMCFHFFAKEITYGLFKKLEVRDLDKEGDFESLGLVRVPLFSLPNKFLGFPNFLQNNFIGLAKDQLIHGIKVRNLLDADKLKEHIFIAEQHYK